MHRFIFEQLAAERVKDQLAAADDARRTRQARRARSQASAQGVRPSLPGPQAGLERADPRSGRHQRRVHSHAPLTLLIRVVRALQAVHQELEIASECLLRPGPAPQADVLAWIRTRSGYCLGGRYLPRQ